ncbi:c-type cytochrome [Paucibacter sp. PLA-PC-4]|uniref:c-type cytochrome n=1 Tax=Paucibacter sp. PLA-PC-4 TaxID=2993655 RepID=UPI002B0560AC|nr:c-type cytochrome [Paucibacter sp. PLA-PC-4]
MPSWTLSTSTYTGLTLAALLALGPSDAGAAGPAGTIAAGKATFVAACASCHQVGPSARGGFGPQLNGIVGRQAGSTPDYSYSAAMRKSGIVWSETSLAAFIRDPQRSVPGTKMRFFSIGYNDQKMANLLAYLASVPATPPSSPTAR